MASFFLHLFLKALSHPFEAPKTLFALAAVENECLLRELSFLGFAAADNAAAKTHGLRRALVAIKGLDKRNPAIAGRSRIALHKNVKQEYKAALQLRIVGPVRRLISKPSPGLLGPRADRLALVQRTASDEPARGVTSARMVT